jgi:ribonucleoside-diphosphate reductase alpha chain
LHDEETEYKIYTPIVKEYMEKFNLHDENELPDFFINAKQLNYIERIDMQAIWQSHIDASISSTINLPFATPEKQVEDIYMYAWEKGLKGITIYREGCKRDGILNSENQIQYEKANGTCQDCGGNNLIKVGGCTLCQDCGYSPCSV